MKHYVGIIVAMIALTGCGAEEVVVIPMTQEVSVMEEGQKETEPKPQQQEGQRFPEELVVREDVPAASALSVIDAPVTWGFTRANRDKNDIDTVIIHSVYNALAGNKQDMQAIRKVFANYGVAPHYIIDRDGAVYRTVAEKDIAYHVGRSQVPDGRTNVNTFSIGVELINALDNTYTDAQYASLKALLADISTRYALKYVLGHDEAGVHDPWNFDWSQINAFRHEAR